MPNTVSYESWDEFEVAQNFYLAALGFSTPLMKIIFPGNIPPDIGAITGIG